MLHMKFSIPIAKSSTLLSTTKFYILLFLFGLFLEVIPFYVSTVLNCWNAPLIVVYTVRKIMKTNG